ncbi:MAG: integrase [Rhodospirillaceae bacterium]|nr:integrase [Rhodospirillaceae bacterium]
MARKKRIRKNEGGFQHSNHEILGGKSKVFRVPNSGDVWQFQMWIPEEKKYLRKSLRTKDLETAKSRAEELYLQTYSDVSSGRKIFGMTLQGLVDEYLKWREDDVSLGNITKGRHGTMQSQLKHLVSMKGGVTKIGELDRNSCYEYEVWRVKTFPKTKKVTIRNEQATINAMMKYGYRNGYSHLESFDFRKMVIKGKDIGRRDTFSLEEYDRLVRYMRTYVSKRACPDETERLERMMVRDAILIASNTMLRVGELWNLKWKDIVDIETVFDEDEKQMSLVTINVRPEIAKTRKGRVVPVRGGEYVERLRARSTHTAPEDYIFCGIGKPTKTRTIFWYDHWNVLMNAIDIGDYKERQITWYSLRHFGITCRIRAKVLLSDIAKLAGTSTAHVESTYGHWDQEMLRGASMKNFTLSANGIAYKD